MSECSQVKCVAVVAKNSLLQCQTPFSVSSSKFDQKPEPGDLIEIFRGNYQHWALYIGDGFVVHLAPPCESCHTTTWAVTQNLSSPTTLT